MVNYFVFKKKFCVKITFFCDVEYFDREVLNFSRNLLLPSSGFKNGDEGGRFLSNVGKYEPNFTTSYLERS
jgi:hypothetical protein